jgi:polar amino acid transport system substrate-binding protein
MGRLVAAVIFGGAAACGPLFADGIRVRVVTESLPPYSFEERGVVTGASTAVVRAVLEQAGLPYTIEVLPWMRAFDTVLHEPNTLIYSVARTEGRERQLIWVGKICDRRLALYCLKGRNDLLGRPIGELGSATVAVIQGDASGDLLRKLGVREQNLHVLRDAPATLAATHVLEGRSDFFVSNPERVAYGMRGTLLEGRFQQHSLLWEGDGYYLAAHPASDRALIGRVRDAFAALAARNAIKELFAQALPKPTE